MAGFSTVEKSASPLMAILAVGFKLHLRLFDRFFLRLGRLERLRKMREAGTHDAH